MPNTPDSQGKSLTGRSRNRATILASARVTLARNPDASMEEVAVAANVVRRTLYGHFVSRDELIEAILKAGADEMLEIVTRRDVENKPAEEALAIFALELWPTGEELWPIVVHAQQTARVKLRRAMQPLRKVIKGVLLRGQSEGKFATHLDADRLADVLADVSVTLHRARRMQGWKGGAQEAAVSALIAAGVSQHNAEAAIGRATTHQSGEYPLPIS